MSIYSEAIIYMATNMITGEKYIGYTSLSLDKRKNGHKSRSKKVNKNIKFYNSIKKYGWENFTWKIIYESWDKNHCLTKMEPHFINEYDTYNNGLNSTKGGECLEPELVSKISKERWKDESFREKMSIIRSKQWLITDPNGTIYKIKNLSDFCKEHKLDDANMVGVSKGRYKQYRGWTCKKLD